MNPGSLWHLMQSPHNRLVLLHKCCLAALFDLCILANVVGKSDIAVYSQDALIQSIYRPS